MGVERAVTRWYVQSQVLLDEIVALEATLIQMMSATPARVTEEADEAALNAPLVAEKDALLLKLAETQEKLRRLGPCPKPMMG